MLWSTLKFFQYSPRSVRFNILWKCNVFLVQILNILMICSGISDPSISYGWERECSFQVTKFKISVLQSAPEASFMPHPHFGTHFPMTCATLNFPLAVSGTNWKLSPFLIFKICFLFLEFGFTVKHFTYFHYLFYFILFHCIHALPCAPTWFSFSWRVRNVLIDWLILLGISIFLVSQVKLNTFIYQNFI